MTKGKHMSLKVTSINFVKDTEVPTTVRNTEMQQIIAGLVAQIAKIEKGKALTFKMAGAKKWTRYALQTRLRKATNNEDVSVTQREDVFYVTK